MEMSFILQEKKVFDLVIGGTRGGPSRLAIVVLLSKGPRNTNELAKLLKIDYKTAEYHLRVLAQNCIVSQKKGGYASKFQLTPLFREYWDKAHKAARGSKK